jgi:hypothetical protein
MNEIFLISVFLELGLIFINEYGYLWGISIKLKFECFSKIRNMSIMRGN